MKRKAARKDTGTVTLVLSSDTNKNASRTISGDAYEDTQTARKFMDQQNYKKALFYYNKAISQRPANMDDLCKERNTCVFFIKTQSEDCEPPTSQCKPQDKQILKSISSYAKDHAATPQRSMHAPEKCKDLYFEQALLIQAYSLYEAGNNAEAFEVFERATSGQTTKAEASFCMAEMMHTGIGTPRDKQKAISIIQDVALLPHKNPVDTFNDYRNVGVEESRDFLGHYFQVTSRKDPTTTSNGDLMISAMWFWLGYHCGHSPSSHTLAVMFLKGSGVPYSDTNAEFYWKAAAEQGYPEAYIHLAKLYIEQFEFEKAQRAIELGSKSENPKIVDTVQRIFEDVCSKQSSTEYLSQMNQLKIFETANPPNEDLTVQQRLAKMDRFSSFVAHLQRFYAEINLEKGIFLNVGDRCSVLRMEKAHYEDLCWKYILDESVQAQELHQTIIRYSKILTFLNQRAYTIENVTCSKENTIDFVMSLWDMLKVNPFVLKWENEIVTKVYSILRKIYHTYFTSKEANIKVDNFSKALSICLAEIGAKVHFDTSGFKLLMKAWTLYPDEVQLTITLAEHYVSKQELEKAYMATAEALERVPNHVNLLFKHAQICSHITSDVIKLPTEMRRIAIQHYMKFLGCALVDHPKVPEAYYALGKLFWDTHMEFGDSGIPLSLVFAKHFWNLGGIAEKDQLKVFLPYKSAMKDALCTIISNSMKYLNNSCLPKNNFTGSTLISMRHICELIFKDESRKENLPSITRKVKESAGSVVKTITEDSHRIALLVRLREGIKCGFSNNGNKKQILRNSCNRGNFPESNVISVNKLNPISVREMLSQQDCKIWEDRVLSLTVLDEAFTDLRLNSILLVAEDLHRDVIQVVLHGFPRQEQVQSKFGFGCKLTILQPNVEEVHGEKIVQVLQPNKIVCDDSLRKQCPCRYCLKPGAKLRCSRCIWANYCNKDCQLQDWKILKHKNICFKIPARNQTRPLGNSTGANTATR